MRRSSIICVLLTLAVVQAQNGYDYNRPSKPFGQSSTTRPDGFSNAGYEGYPRGRPSTDGSSTSIPRRPLSPGYPGSSPAHTAPSSSDQGYPGATSTGYPQGQRPTQPKPGFQGQGAGYPGQSSYEQSRPDSDVGTYPGQSSGQSGGSFSVQDSRQTYPGQSTTTPTGGYRGQSSSQTYPGYGSGQTGGYSGQSSPSQSSEQTGGYAEQATGQVYPEQNYPSQTGPETQSFGSGLVPGSGTPDTGAYEGGDYSAIPGEPGRDYPILTEIPDTSFKCDAQAYPGYYADIETRCQVFHICANNRTYDFLCPNGTIFSQEVFVCVWWNQFDCNTAPSLYNLNANLYDYTIMGGAGFTGSLGEYPQSSQGSVYPGQSSNLPSGVGSQGPSIGYPDNSGQQGLSSKYPSSTNYQKPSITQPGITGPQDSSIGYPVSTSSQGSFSGYANVPNQSYPSKFGTQAPSLGYPGSTGSREPSSVYPPSTGAQQNLAGLPDSTGSQGPSTGYLASSASQKPPVGYPGNNGGQSSSSEYSGNTGSQRPTAGYPNSGIEGQRPSSLFPTSQRPSGFQGSQGTQNYPVSRPNFESSQGYPSGKPNGPRFPPGPNERRPIGGQTIQNGSASQPQQPNREYLPPRK